MNAPDELKLPAVPTDRPAGNFLEQSTSYWIDAAQRSILLLDVLRERANNMLEHERKGLPPLLVFDYEVLLDARSVQRPATDAVLRVLGAHGEHDHRRLGRVEAVFHALAVRAEDVED